MGAKASAVRRVAAIVPVVNVTVWHRAANAVAKVLLLENNAVAASVNQPHRAAG